MKYYAFILLLCCCGFAVSATLTVDNRYPSIGQYTTLQAAHDAATNGDALYIYPSPVNYGNLTVTKSLSLIGGGFNYDYATSGTISTIVGSITFEVNSVNCCIEGIQASAVTIRDSNIIVSNCCITGCATLNADHVLLSKSKIGSIKINPNHVSNSICSCLITSASSPTNYVYSSIFIDSNNEVSIMNNLIDTRGAYGSGELYYLTSLQAIRTGTNCTALIVNNFIGGTNSTSSEYSIVSNSSCSIIASNNIIQNTMSGVDLSFFNNNLTSFSNAGLNPTNIQSVNISSLFVDFTNRDYHLNPGSAAIGAGENGIDCGAYGGVSPFDDTYNTPSLPTTIELSTPTTIVPTDEPMPVHIRATTSGN